MHLLYPEGNVDCLMEKLLSRKILSFKSRYVSRSRKKAPAMVSKINKSLYIVIQLGWVYGYLSIVCPSFSFIKLPPMSGKDSWYFFAFATGVLIINSSWLFIASKMNESGNVLDILSGFGRHKIEQNPNDYYTPENYRKYKLIMKYSNIFMWVAIAVFLLVTFIL